MTIRLIAIVVVSFLFAGCGKKPDNSSLSPATQSVVEPASGNQSPAAPSTATSTQPVPGDQSSTAPDLAQPAQGDMKSMLDELTWSVRQYCIANHSVPASLDEVAAAGFITNMPTAPAGKKFAIDPKKIQVVLVNQ
jgi:hypothetical protein